MEILARIHLVVNVNKIYFILCILLNFKIAFSVIPEFYTAEDYDFIEVERHYSNYKVRNNDWQKTLRDITIENLIPTIQLFDGCLIHITNYNGVDLPPLQQPVLLSRYDLVHVKYQAISKIPSTSSYRSNVTRYSLRARTFPFEKVPENEIEMPWCRRYWPDLQCLDIPYLDMSTKAKPWTCEAHLYLLPPSPEQDPNFYEWLRDKNRLSLLVPGGYHRIWSNWWPFYETYNDDSQHEKMDVNQFFILNRHWYDILISDSIEDNMVSPWVTALLTVSSFMTDEQVPSHRELLLIPALTGVKDLDNVLEKSSIRFGSMILLCRNCKPCVTLQPTPIGTPTDRHELDEIIKNHNKHTNHILWKVFAMGDLLNMLKRFFKREKHTSFHSLMRDPSPEAILWKLKTRYLAAIFNNATFQSIYTFPMDKLTECGWDDSRITDYDPILHIYLAGKSDHTVIVNKWYSLRFVSCGRPETNNLAFKELISIFDTKTWIYLNLLTLTVALLSSYGSWKQEKGGNNSQGEPILNIGSFWNYFHEYCVPSFMSYYKVLVEQGDPIAVAVFKIPFLRSIYLSYMVVGIVLSNAYKNDNISRLTLPLEAIPYENFDQLVKHKFEIFTRGFFYTGISGISVVKSLINLEDLGISWLGEGKLFNLDFDYMPYIKPDPPHDDHDISFVFQSELMLYAKSERSQRGRNVTKTIFSNRTQYLLNHTRLHERWWEQLNKNLSNFDLIKVCNKTAILLPEIDAYPLYYKLLQEKFKDVYLSKEAFFALSYGVLFWRSVNPFILQRAQGMVQSNIMEHWNQFVVHFMTSVKSGYGGRTLLAHSVEPVASDMKGNIVVVFTLLPLGVVVSILIFVIEIRRHGHVKIQFEKIYVNFFDLVGRIRFMINKQSRGNLNSGIRDVESCKL
ncbi:unnamed protein product [Orchesella dallaii]|uniref:Uncharacterized protein n=1 Tax=Orchesella dallaii TaxID=48710 RepID=A0ABP1PJR3_9HEXA